MRHLDLPGYLQILRSRRSRQIWLGHIACRVTGISWVVAPSPAMLFREDAVQASARQRPPLRSLALRRSSFTASVFASRAACLAPQALTSDSPAPKATQYLRENTWHGENSKLQCPTCPGTEIHTEHAGTAFNQAARLFPVSCRLKCEIFSIVSSAEFTRLSVACEFSCAA